MAAHEHPLVDEVRLELPPRAEPPRRAPFVPGARRGPKLGDPCPACNEADLVQKGSKMGCPRTECWYVQPCCQP